MYLIQIAGIQIVILYNNKSLKKFKPSRLVTKLCGRNIMYKHATLLILMSLVKYFMLKQFE